MISKALTIAGFDGSGGAGIQADLKTFSALGCYATTVLTSLPVQNTTGVKAIYDIDTKCIEEQIISIFDDISIDAVKIGMLHRQEIIDSVASLLSHYRAKNIVLDPVMVAKSGDLLLRPDAITALKERLFPLATLITPNLLETSHLVGRTIQTKEEMETAAYELAKLGSQAVLVKGGHLSRSADDCLYFEGTITWFPGERIHTKNTHGTGCTFSAAIAAYLAKGFSLQEAVTQAKEYLTQAIAAGAHLHIGKGNGPVHHLWMQNALK